MAKHRTHPLHDQQLVTREHLRKDVDAQNGDAGGMEFDVFLSYNSLDRPVVERIAEQLRREGLRPFLDIWGMTPGAHWQRELAKGLALSKTCALFVGPNPVGTWQLEELELALVRANHRSAFRMFPVLLPGVEDPFDAQRLPPFLSTRTWVDLRSGTSSPRALQRLLNAIQGVAHGSDAPAEPLGDVVPYRGLATFEEEHAALFFGRERDIQRLIEILKTSPLLCVVGPSGSGKSSLVRAGLVPRLRKAATVCAEDCKVCLLRPGAHPLEALATQLAPLGAGSSMHATLENLKTDRRTLHLAVSLAVGPDAPRSRVLIVVDQLEEVFTRCEDEREREQSSQIYCTQRLRAGARRSWCWRCAQTSTRGARNTPNSLSERPAPSHSSVQCTTTSSARRSRNPRDVSACSSNQGSCRRSSMTSARTPGRCHCLSTRSWRCGAGA
jgi:Novel STAND NTPase 1/TIR domain